ncbi:hypothetical protein AOXY_G12204 [Acipenser oxyrinchus oxyrinchus]|uniref:Uncharacterized protein n=1 Tax=Acipenser oxyrinchus oxyrinchus TaxID=40147 RepID=A0AAD8G7F4_ACIOX|nr:hypothetical protein AOXY_G12204 [Acipenser oxyrinchus oxyrinchus]
MEPRRGDPSRSRREKGSLHCDIPETLNTEDFLFTEVTPSSQISSEQYLNTILQLSPPLSSKLIWPLRFKKPSPLIRRPPSERPLLFIYKEVSRNLLFPLLTCAVPTRNQTNHQDQPSLSPCSPLFLTTEKARTRARITIRSPYLRKSNL